ncbi:hypothetical protein BH10PSE13_BH10PSE13_23720 [soil metagenome]
MDQPAPSIRLFRPGDFVSNEGKRVSFSEADLAAVAASYDAGNDPAPLVIGHPKLNDPAWGWVAGLSFADGELVAAPEKVDPDFAQIVRAGRYSRVSAQFYPPAHPSNPKPGAYYLKHIGFLGAAAPAVKGLGTVAFSAGDEAGSLTFDLNPEHSMTIKTTEELSFAERLSALDAREAALAGRETTIAQREEADRIAAEKARHEENVSFADGLIAATTLAPAHKDIVVGVLDLLDAAAVVSFGEAGEMPPVEAFRKLLSSGAPLLDLGEHGKKQGDDKTYTSFAAPDGYTVDPAKAELFNRAEQIQQENPTLAWMDCVSRAERA